MNRTPVFASIAFTSPHQPLQSGVKRFFALMSAVLTAILLGVLVTSCEPIVSDGSGTQQPTPTPGLTDCGNGVFVQQGTSCPGSGGGGGGVTPTPIPYRGPTSPIDEGDFAINHRAATGPAIVEWWNGQGGADKVCGTFQLPSGQTFDYHPAGHWWRYKSDQDMQAEWQLHVSLFKQKPENAPCSVGQRPS